MGHLAQEICEVTVTKDIKGVLLEQLIWDLILDLEIRKAPMVMESKYRISMNKLIQFQLRVVYKYRAQIQITEKPLTLVLNRKLINLVGLEFQIVPSTMNHPKAIKKELFLLMIEGQ